MRRNVRFVGSGINDFRSLDCQRTTKARFDAQRLFLKLSNRLSVELAPPDAADDAQQCRQAAGAGYHGPGAIKRFLVSVSENDSLKNASPFVQSLSQPVRSRLMLPRGRRDRTRLQATEKTRTKNALGRLTDLGP
jgi:hypothetical protein